MSVMADFWKICILRSLYILRIFTTELKPNKTMKPASNQISRRTFIGTSLVGMAGLSLFPMSSCKKNRDHVNIGFIGLGRQSMYLLSSFINIEGVTVLAGADVFGIKRERFLKRTTEHYREKGENVDIKVYEDYHDILKRRDIDAVVIASPDFWHALMAIEACQAGKDIYLEKPLTFTIKEGIELVKAVRDNDCILGVGSQQRSDPNFQHAIKLVQDGKLGKIQKVNVWVGKDFHPIPYDAPAEPLPEGLDWKKWIGPAPMNHYNHLLNPPISLDPPKDEEFWGAWRWYKEYGGGLMTDWGAHMMDIAQWGLGVDRSGPLKITPAGHDGAEYLTYEYPGGIPLTIEDFHEDTRGVKFWGTDSWIEVARGYFDASDESLKPEVKEDEVAYEAKSAHHVNFIESVMSHHDPVVPVEIGHRSATACNLGNIAYFLGRSVQWDPETQRFVNDAEADNHLFRAYENGYKLP